MPAIAIQTLTAEASSRSNFGLCTTSLFRGNPEASNRQKFNPAPEPPSSNVSQKVFLPGSRTILLLIAECYPEIARQQRAIKKSLSGITEDSDHGFTLAAQSDVSDRVEFVHRAIYLLSYLHGEGRWMEILSAGSSGQVFTKNLSISMG